MHTHQLYNKSEIAIAYITEVVKYVGILKLITYKYLFNNVMRSEDTLSY